MTFELDHLVVAAANLEQGARWCEATLGVEPGPGGRHALMGTHNRLLSIASAAFARAYLEIVAIDPDAPPPPHRRWFALDEPALQRRLQRDGPQLVHWVARVRGLASARDTLRALGPDPGEPTRATRGDYRWHIGVRADGVPPLGGAWPGLIEWDGPHPADALPACGVQLRAFALGGLDAAQRRALGAVASAPAADAPLVARLHTPRGEVELRAVAGWLDDQGSRGDQGSRDDDASRATA